MINPNKPPHNLDAEASVLGAILMDESRLSKAEEHLHGEDFFSKKNQLIFENMLALRENHMAIDVVTLAERLQNQGVFNEIGGYAYLSELVDRVPMLSNYEGYCKIVQDQALLRRLVDTTMEILDGCYGEYERVSDVVELAEQKIFKVGQGYVKGDFEDAKSVVMATLNHIEEIRKNRGKLTGLPTGFTELDYYTSGLQPSDLIYIAARPSMGKTAFALNLAQHAALKENAVVAIFSLEMSKTQLMQRMICSQGMIDLSKLRSGDLSEEDWQLLGDASARLYGTEIKIDDSAGLTLGDIRSKSRRLKAEQGLDMILIDYLQLMSSRGRSENRQNEISEISRGLKALARELHCPIVCLSQLSRAPDGRPDHHPMLADLRESGSIEQDADVVMFLYREYYYDKENANPNMAECIVAKQRNGPTGKIDLTWRPEFTKFMDFADDSRYPDPGPGF